MEALRCSSCLAKFIRCSSCKREELKFNEQWKTVCNNSTCATKGKEGSLEQVDEIAACKTCRANYKCHFENCSLIAKRKCQKCPRFIGLCEEHNSSNSRHHTDMCEGCGRKFCDKCESLQNYYTSSCDSCGLRQCNNCFDFKNEIHDGKIISYTCLLCKSESERQLYPHNILLTVNLEDCYESCPCQHPCTVKVRSGTIVETLLLANVIKDMMLKAEQRSSVAESIRENWQPIYEHCYENFIDGED